MSLYLNRKVLSWGLYDFANSAFATTILSVIFNVYFVKIICADGVPFLGTLIPGESFWAYSVAFSMLVVFGIAPLLGTIADHTASKKKFLLFFCGLGCLFTGAFYFLVEGDVWLAALFFIFANIGFSAGNVFYNALLQEVSSPQTVGRISGIGWSLGYLGGGLLLALNLVLIKNPEWFGLSRENHLPERVSFFSVAVWWAVFSVPLFLSVKEKNSPNPARSIKENFRAAFNDLKETFRNVRNHKEIFKYLFAYLIYNDGIETVILMASIFGAKELGMSQSDLVLCFLMIQSVALFGALVFGNIADRIGHKIAIGVTLGVYVIVCLWATVMKSQYEFWILGAVVGVVLGGSQAASRSLLVLLTPEEKSAQSFGFFALTGKLSVVFGPLIFGFLSQLYSLRTAVGSLTVFFVLGFLVLFFVKEPSLSASDSKFVAGLLR